MEGVDIQFRGQHAGSIEFDLDSPTTRYPVPFILGQPEVEEALEKVLRTRGFEVEWGAEVINIALQEDYVEVTLRSGEQIQSHYVVGCDGAHSFVRKSQPGWLFQGAPLNLLWAQCDGTLTDSQIRTTRAAAFLGNGNVPFGMT